ncbi:MAG: hypothetical protein D6743_14630 [Calditrichaeota bacterium]|nr:MAG: hypothetical protein D6743_14630 [Calditrichota bacterium]
MVIKSGAGKLTEKVKRHVLPELRSRAESGLEMSPALSQSEKLALCQSRLEEVDQELSRVRETRYQEGFEDGQKVGYEEGLKAIAPQVKALEQILERVEQEQNQLILAAERFVVQFAMKVAQRILGQEAVRQLPLNQERLAAAVAQALKRFTDARRFVVRANRATVQQVQGYLRELSSQLPEGVEVTVVDDPSVQVGDCLVESDFGVLDARVDSALHEMEGAFVRGEGEVASS